MKHPEGGSLLETDIVAALRQALTISADTSEVGLHKTNGYYKDPSVKIGMPSDVHIIYDNLDRVPGGDELTENAILAINRAAEDAAVNAKTVFHTTISAMAISNGPDILKGTDSAATNYVRGKAYNTLFLAFQPSIDSSLAKNLVGGLPARNTYQKMIDAYNKASIGGLLYDEIKTDNNNLSIHVTKKALDGFLVKIALHEKKIRTDTSAQVTNC